MSVWLAFFGGASICSASEPYSYNGLRNRISGNVAPVFLGLWRAPPAGAVSAPCTPARCHTSFNCSCYVLKGLRRPVSTRRFFVFVRRSDKSRLGAWLLYYYRCSGCQVSLSEPGFEGFEGLKE